MWDDYGKPRPGRMPIDVYENGQIVFTQNSFASDAPIGTVVGIISVINATAPYKLSVGKNPYFSVSGHNLISNATLVSGVVYVQIFAVKGFKRIVQAIRIVVGGNSVPAPPQLGFSIGLNMTGVYQGSGNAPLTPTVQNFAYYTNFGMPIFRIPFAWSIAQTFPPFFTTGIQPVAFGDLDAGYLAVLDQTIANAIAAGGKVILDCHMFMTGPGGFLVGSAQVPTTALADLWGKIAAHYVALPALLAGIIGLEFMNEPKNGFPTPTIVIAYNQCIAACRTVGYTGFFYLDGTNFDSAWNWVSGDGQPYSSDTLTQVLDPLNKLVDSSHIYPDANDSGGGGAYATESVTAGSAPVGINTNPNIFVQRVGREYVPWGQQNGRRLHIGEYGSSNDSPNVGGTFNCAAWNLISFNAFEYLQSLGIPINIWSGGPGFPAGFGGYFYSLDPFNSDLSGATDFSSNGVQAPLIAVIQQFTGYAGPQPTAYALISPSFPQPGNGRTVAGAPSGNFTVYYGGVIPVARHVTPAVFLADGVTAATGVTITPSTVTLPPGVNAVQTFTFTTPDEDRYVIKVTNDAGWVNPPSIFISSVADDFVDVPNSEIETVVSMAREFSPYNGPACIVLHPSTGIEVTLDYAADGSPDAATWSTLCGGASSAKLIRRFNQAPTGSINDVTPLFGYPGTSGSNAPSNWPASSPSDYPTLLFADTDGFPKIIRSAGNRMYTNLNLSGKTGLTISGRMNDTGHVAVYLDQELFVGGPLNWGPQGIGIRHGASAASVATLPVIADIGSWQTYSTTMQANPSATTPGGLIQYLNEVVNNQADMPAYSFDPQFGAKSTDVGYDRYVPSLQWTGADRSLRVLTAAVSAAKIAAFSATDTANWGAPFTPPPPPAFAFPLIGVNNMGNSLINGGPLNDYIGNNPTTQNGEIALWSGQFFNVFRMGFNWNTLQPTLQGPLDATAMGFFQAAVDKCIAGGIGVILDMHNFSGRGPTINSNADYGDLWGRLAAWFSYVTNQDMVMYNTPNNEPGGGGLTQATLTGLNTACVAAIRAAGATGWVIASGLNFTKPTTFVSNGPAMIAAIADPQNKTGHDSHWYNDLGSQGTSTVAIVGAGNALKSACRMARQTGTKLFLGETGIPNNAGMQAEAHTLFQTMSDYRDVILGWTPWVYGTEINGSDPYNLGPTNPAGPSVAAVLLPHGDARRLTGTLNGALVNWIPACDGGYIPSTTSLGTTVASLMPNDQNIKGANYTYTKTVDAAGLLTLSGTNLVLATAPTNGTTYSVTIHIVDDLGRSADTVISIVGANKPYLDANTKSSLVTLSNSNRTATFATGSFAQVRSTRGVPPGSIGYFEVAVSDTSGFIGFTNADANLTTDNSTLSTSFPPQGSFVGGGFQANGNMQPTFVANVGVTRTAAQVIGIWMDNINFRISVRNVTTNGNWNGNVANDPTVGSIPISPPTVPGTWYAYVGLVTAGQSATFNFASADLAHAPPAGSTVIP